MPSSNHQSSPVEALVSTTPVVATIRQDLHILHSPTNMKGIVIALILIEFIFTIVSSNGALTTMILHAPITVSIPHQRRIMEEGVGNIVLPAEPENAICDFDMMNQRSTISETWSNANVDFWYAIGTSQFENEDRILFELNQRIYRSMQETNVWCTPLGQNETQNTTRLGVVTFVPSDSTVSENLSCQASSFINTTVSDIIDCRVIHGTLQVLGQPMSTIAAATTALQMELQQVITNLMTTSNMNSILEGVRFFSYLGNTEEEASTFLYYLIASHSNTGSNVDAIEENIGTPTDSTRTGLIVGLTIPFIGLLLAAIFWKKRKIVSSYLPSHQVFESWEDYDPKSNNVRGTGDPPDSYHDGLYHHMFDGQKYLSTQCLLCLETRRNTQLVLKSLPTTSSNTMDAERDKKEAEDSSACPILKATSRMKLGQQHLGMDVHVCSSATCARCFPQDDQEPTFLHTGIKKHPRNPPSPASSSGSSLESGSEFPASESIDPYDIESLRVASTLCTVDGQLPVPPKRKRYLFRRV